MNAQKKKLLDETMDRFLQTMLNNASADNMEHWVDKAVMGFGTTRDEKIFSLEFLKEGLFRQREQAQGIESKMEIHPVFRRISKDENTAVFVDEIELTFFIGEPKHVLFLRLSTMLEYENEQWSIVHFHASNPVGTDGSEDTWHIREWERKNAELEKLVAEKTTDLVQKNRELEIEAALERIRARALAMHQSPEIKDVAAVMRNELLGLGLKGVSAATIWLEQPNGKIRAWDFTIVENTSLDKDVQVDIEFDPKDAPPRAHFHKIWNRRGKYWVGESDLEDLYESVNWLKTQDEAAATEMLHLLDSGELKYWWHPTTVLEKGRLNVDFVVPPPEEMATILPKMAAVFDLAYRRFEDLQKAEEQAREAQIEAALERVRSRTMAMHKSDELAEIVAVIYQEVGKLGFADWGCNIQIFNEQENAAEIWISENLHDILPKPYYFRDVKHPDLLAQWDAWRNKTRQYTLSLKGESKKSYDDYVLTHTDFRLFPDEMKQGIRSFDQVHFNMAWMQYGFIVSINTAAALDKTQFDILSRFAKVFEQTYTRFLDLQKAEAQAREAQIEAALERVRSRAIAMRHSDELSEAAEVLYQEFLKMGVESFSCGYLINDDEKQEWKIWLTNPGEKFFKQYWTCPYFADHNLRARYESWKRQEEFHCAVLEGEENQAHHVVISTYAPWKEAMLDSLPPQLVFNSAHFSLGHLLVISPERLAPELEQAMVRFAKVFDLAYRRFLDLQIAEAQAREAKIDAALDRVRAEIASMRSTQDLEHITPLVWRELTALEVPFFRCGVFIMDEDKALVHTYLSTPEGKSLSVLDLPMDGAETTRQTVMHWRKQAVYLDHWDQQQFIGWVQSLTEQGYLREGKAYQGSEEAPEALALHFVPFQQGMLYVGSSESLSEVQIELVKRLADTFTVAYARYEDFIRLEEAKHKVETTLTELKTTQAQLIQAEKLASLGELTAGIAHEIQNPLNFVNNFSEVSTEMLNELKEELAKGETEEAHAIADDLKTNLQKITHHGQRASGIVKSMLEHSRQGRDATHRVPTDINTLADEYLRLAYHGLRAKDNTFNAKMETHFDPDLPLVSVIPQDIGRVLLNLINNAFYAVHQRATTVGAPLVGAHDLPKDAHDLPKGAHKGRPYQPTVTVSTQKMDNQILIKIQDNGSGIPESIREKIFQPFFTTKPAGQGTGLGLSLSYDIIKAHGGELNLETQEGQGTEFLIRIPG